MDILQYFTKKPALTKEDRINQLARKEIIKMEEENVCYKEIPFDNIMSVRIYLLNTSLDRKWMWDLIPTEKRDQEEYELYKQLKFKYEGKHV